MAEYTLVIGNRNYSSWSLRAWLAARLAGLAFDEIVIPLDEPGTAASIAHHSPSGRVPVLLHGGIAIWESLAILEFIAERRPQAGLWPADPDARAVARSVAAEMHAGFMALRAGFAMNIRARFVPRASTPEEAADIARITALWRDCRGRFGSRSADDRGFLFGTPGAADAMFAPVVTRFTTYGIELPDDAQAYCRAVTALPAMQEWSAAAAAEPWALPGYDPPAA